jgi:hypothetical protein
MLRSPARRGRGKTICRPSARAAACTGQTVNGTTRDMRSLHLLGSRIVQHDTRHVVFRHALDRFVVLAELGHDVVQSVLLLLRQPRSVETNVVKSLVRRRWVPSRLSSAGLFLRGHAGFPHAHFDFESDDALTSTTFAFAAPFWIDSIIFLTSSFVSYPLLAMPIFVSPSLIR